MENSHTAFSGSVPENYDRYLGPFLFEHYAEIIADRISKIKPSKVLDIACGTGIVTKKIAEALPEARVIGLDLNPDMINFGKKTHNGGVPIEWEVSDAHNLPFDNDSFDAVTCQFGIMFFPDKIRVLDEVKRVLKPNGVFIFNTWDSLEVNNLFQTTDKVISDMFKDNPPDFYKVPFSYYDTNEIKMTLDKAGFRDIKIEHIENEAVSETAESLTIGLVEGNPIYGQITQRDASKVPAVKDQIEKAVSEKFGNRPVKVNLSAIMCTCSK